MKKLIPIFAIAILGVGVGIVGAADPMMEKEATPTISERFTNDTVNGTLMKMDGEYYWVKDTDGKEVKLHVDKSTKLDKVQVGDKVKAYITDSGHTTTLQRGD